MADKYLLRVTAGPDYDTSKHTLVSVNTPHPTKISSALGSALISVRIQNYHGKAPFPGFLAPLRQPDISTGPPPSSPVTSPYFSQPAHTHDQYSISFVIRPNASIPGSSLVFGNDFSYPIRDRLPPGFNTALHIVKWAIDPGLDGDVNSDTPYLYGNALSSLNTLRVMGSGDNLEEWDGELEKGLEEGGERGGEVVRREIGVPEGAQARKKWFLEKGKTDKWVWEKGTVYGADFFNPYLDFNEFSLKLPGFSLSILKYLMGEDYLRYVLKNKDTGEIFFVVQFALVPREHPPDSSDDGSDTEAEAQGRESESGHRESKKFGEENATEQAIRTNPKTQKATEKEGIGGFEPSPSDLD